MTTRSDTVVVQTLPGGTRHLESRLLHVAIEPAHGGKIRSFTSKRTGVDYLFTDPRTRFTDLGGYSDHDISGFDECFPTVWACNYPDGGRQGMALSDHGYLWRGAWRIEQDAGARSGSAWADQRITLVKEIPELHCRFRRTCYLDGEASLKLEYMVENCGDEPLKYIYSAHPMLASDRDTRLVLGEGVKEVFVFFAANAGRLTSGSWAPWPLPDDSNSLPPFDWQRKSVVKLYTPAGSCSKARIERQGFGEALQFECDPVALPHLGVLISQGYDTDDAGPFRREVFLGLEPTTGMGDDLPTCETTGTVKVLQPGQPLRFWIRLSLLTL